MKATVSFICIFLLGLLFLLGCPSSDNYNAGQESIPGINPDTITDATGVIFSEPFEYFRLISLTPNMTDNLKLLGAESRLIGRTNYCKVTGEIPSVGNMLEPSIEKVVSLSPDLILASQEGNRPGSIEKLRELKIPVFVFGESNTWKNIRDDFLLLGRLTGKASEAEEIIKGIEKELDDISAENPARGKETGPNGRTILTKVFVQLNIKPLMTAGRNTFIDEIINMSRGYNIASESALSWPTMSVEEIIRINPEVIIVCDMGSMTGEARKVWTEEKYAGLEAVKNNKVFVMDSDLLCQPTPRNFINAVKELREYIYQDE